MKRIILLFVILLALLPLSTLGAYDHIWGGTLDLGLEFPQFYATTFAVSMENSAGVWYRGSWGPAANIEIDGGVGFDLDFLMGLTNQQQFSWHGLGYSIYPELDKLAFYGVTGSFAYKAGRQVTSDPAGLIIDAPMDGVDFNLSLGRHIINLGAGYTGLTFLQSSEYYMTTMDATGALTSPSRIMEYAAWEMPGAASWLNLAVYFLAVQDLTPASVAQSNNAEPFHPMYLELMARGFLGSSFLYDLSLVGQYGMYGSSTVLAGIGQLGFSWLPDGSSRLGVDLIASSGDTWTDRDQYLLDDSVGTDLNQYLPVSIVTTQGYVIEFELGNLASLGVFYARKPKEDFSWEIRTTSFLRTADGPVSNVLVKQAGGSNPFLGQELLFSWNWRPRSDFGWNMKLGLLYTGESVQLDSFLQQYYLDVVPLMFKMGFDFSWSF